MAVSEASLAYPPHATQDGRPDIFSVSFFLSLSRLFFLLSPIRWYGTTAAPAQTEDAANAPCSQPSGWLVGCCTSEHTASGRMAASEASLAYPPPHATQGGRPDIFFLSFLLFLSFSHSMARRRAVPHQQRRQQMQATLHAAGQCCCFPAGSNKKSQQPAQQSLAAGQATRRMAVSEASLAYPRMRPPYCQTIFTAPTFHAAIITAGPFSLPDYFFGSQTHA